MTATLAPERSEVALGEPVWMRLHVANRTGRELTVVVGPRLAGSGLGVEATGPDGDLAPDPFHQRPAGGWLGGLDEVTIPDGEAADVRFDLADFAWLDAPGTWTVRAFPRISTSPRVPPVADPRWATATVAVVAAGPAPTLQPGSGAAWARPGWVLGLAGRAGDADPQARAALDACPCPEATSALMSLLDDRRAEVRRWAARALTTRLPGDPWVGGVHGARVGRRDPGGGGAADGAAPFGAGPGPGARGVGPCGGGAPAVNRRPGAVSLLVAKPAWARATFGRSVHRTLPGVGSGHEQGSKPNG